MRQNDMRADSSVGKSHSERARPDTARLVSVGQEVDATSFTSIQFEKKCQNPCQHFG